MFIAFTKHDGLRAALATYEIDWISEIHIEQIEDKPAADFVRIHTKGGELFDVRDSFDDIEQSIKAAYELQTIQGELVELKGPSDG